MFLQSQQEEVVAVVQRDQAPPTLGGELGGIVHILSCYYYCGHEGRKLWGVLESYTMDLKTRGGQAEDDRFGFLTGRGETTM